MKLLEQNIIPDVERKHLSVETLLQIEKPARKRTGDPTKLIRKADVSVLENVNPKTLRPEM